MCPCDATTKISIPPFVGGDYFCESGRQQAENHFGICYPDDPLWDDNGCTADSSFNNPPYFTKQLPSPITDDIEANSHSGSIFSEDTQIELIELYVK